MLVQQALTTEKPPQLRHLNVTKQLPHNFYGLGICGCSSLLSIAARWPKASWEIWITLLGPSLRKSRGRNLKVGRLSVSRSIAFYPRTHSIDKEVMQELWKMLLVALDALIQHRAFCLGNAAAHGGLGLPTSVNSQDSPTDMSTSQADRGSLPS